MRVYCKRPQEREKKGMGYGIGCKLLVGFSFHVVSGLSTFVLCL